MRIFGKEFKTRRELKATIAQLEADVLMVRSELNEMKKTFPFTLGQKVYDVQLRNAKGRYAKKNASLEHSRINTVIVDEKNYFGLVDRYRRQDVFFDYDVADAFLMDVCEHKS